MNIKDIFEVCRNNIKYTNVINLFENSVLYGSNINNFVDLEKYNINLLDSKYNNNFVFYIYYNISDILYEQVVKLLENKEFEIVQVHSKTKYKLYKEDNFDLYLSYNENQEYVVIKNKDIIVILSKNRDESRCLLYVIRELIRIMGERKRNIVLHSGCVRNDKHNILIVGDSGSGKTTLIFQLLSKTDFEFISNDRTLIDNDLKIFEFPIKIRVGKETINNIETLNKYIEFNKISKMENEKIILYPVDVKKWKLQYKNNNDIITKIIVPNINPFIKNSIERLGCNEIKVILERNCYALKDPEWKDRWFKEEYFLEDKEINANKDKIIESLAKNVKAYRLNYNGILDEVIINKVMEV